VGDLEITVLLGIALVVLGWVVVRVLTGLRADGEGSARADTFVARAGYAAEQSDNLRDFDR
jgi:hypothetical protein